MKNLYEIIDSLIELTATNKLPEDVALQLDDIIDDLINVTQENPVPDMRCPLTQEEFEDMMLFEKLILFCVV